MFNYFKGKKVPLVLAASLLLLSLFVPGALAGMEETQPALFFQSADGELKAWLMDGAARVSSENLDPASVDQGWHVKAVADMDGDGHPDIYWQHEDGSLKVWLMEGLSRVEAADLVNPETGQSSVEPGWDMKAVADLNGSGESDIIWQRDDGQLAIWLMEGQEAVRTGRLYNHPGQSAVSPAWQLSTVSDLFGDGQPEILWQAVSGEFEDELAYWNVDLEGEDFVRVASGRLTHVEDRAQIKSWWRLKAALDLLEDGTPEILYQGISGDFAGQLAYWEMEGAARIGGSRLEPQSIEPGWSLVGAGPVVVVDVLDGKVYNQDQNRFYDQIQEAVDDAAAGETLLVGPGTYEEAVIVETENLTIKAAEKHEALLKLIEAGSGAALSIDAGGVRIEGLKILRDQLGENGAGPARGIRVSGSNIDIVDNHVLGVNIVDGAGIDILGDQGTESENIVIEGNLVEGFAMNKLSQQGLNAGIRVFAEHENSVIKSASIIDNTLQGNKYGVIRVKVAGSYEKVIIEGNTYLDNVTGEVGPTGPVISGEPQQQPFVSRTEESGLGPPLIDNFDQVGMPVRDGEGAVLGYSNYCSAPSMVAFYYKSTDSGDFEPLENRAELPDDLAQTTTIEGETVDYIVRVEWGTINRFIYGIAILASADGTPAEQWSDRLLYNFGGGVGIGNDQGTLSLGNVLLDDFLGQGFAVAHSTGNITSRHYNIIIHGETAMMVKDHFGERYGEPLYTVGYGGSGGAIQQYLIAQNHPGLLDGILPAVAYPDMVTQMIHVGDGMLMEYYMDVVYPNIPAEEQWDGYDEGRWDSYVDREVFHGLPGNDEIVHPIYGEPGTSAFMKAWLGLTQLCINPYFQFGFPDSGLYADLVAAFGPETIMQTHFTHFQDLQHIYGVDEDGWAKITWDNTGVQYGLESLQEGTITKEEFLHLNAALGGWKPPSEMGFPSFPYDHENRQPQRTEASLEAIENAYEAGIVFLGDIDIPVIDYRLYMDHILDMHHFRESFTTRERLEMARGDADNQLIWVSDVENPDYEQIVLMAYLLMDEWLLNIIENPEQSVVENKPDLAVDTAWDAEGNILAQGPGIWEEGGAGFEAFTPYSTSRMLAGSPTHGLMFKPELIPVDEAIARGYYPGDFDEDDFEMLRAIFPAGVADYEEPCLGMPVEVRQLLGLQ